MAELKLLTGTFLFPGCPDVHHKYGLARKGTISMTAHRRTPAVNPTQAAPVLQGFGSSVN